jgi:RIO kinase 1
MSYDVYRDDDPLDFGVQEDYEHLFRSRQARRRRNRPTPKKEQVDETAVVAGLADLTAAEGELTISYQPSEHESGWLLNSLGPFFAQEYVTDVLYMVKGGKEANVYCCQAYPEIGVDYLAAKVYRPHMFRKIRNDAVYRRGRSALSASGEEIVDDRRAFKALENKTRYGRTLQRVSWLMHEYTTLEVLHEAGAAVPRPWFNSENAILMAYLGDGAVAAPTLNQVRLDPAEAQPLFDKIIDNVVLMLQHGVVHGDLSPYNILYWEGDVTLIDFPQVIDVAHNPHATEILYRDLVRVCDYFQKQGVDADAASLADELRRCYWPDEGLE